MSGKRYKRFYVSESENQLTIYDNEGLDDYYHLGNDERDVKGICKLLNEQQSDLNYLARFIGEFKVEEFKLKLRNLRILEEENKQMKKQLEQIPKSIREVWLE